MCGLTGILGPGIVNNDLKMLRELAYISGLRGQDGAGIVQGRLENFKGDEEKAKRWNKYRLKKSYHDITFFQWYNLNHPEGDKNLFQDITNNFFAVHVRAATQGRICTENAHPFDCTNIVGMHNGTLLDHKYDSKEKTDSELLIKDIDEKGIIPVLSNLNPNSAYAIVIIDKRDGKISFIRNRHRELFCCYNKNRAVMYWASEKWMLDGIFYRNNEDMLENSVFHFEAHKVHSLYVDDFKRGTTKVFDELITFSPLVHQNNNNNNNNAYKNNFNRIDWGHQEYIPPEKKRRKENDENKQLLALPPPQNNIKIFPKLHVANKIPYGTCVDCKKKLNLVDQFFAKKFPMQPALFICKNCDPPPFEPGLINTEDAKIG